MIYTNKIFIIDKFDCFLVFVTIVTYATKERATQKSFFFRPEMNDEGQWSCDNTKIFLFTWSLLTTPDPTVG